MQEKAIELQREDSPVQMVQEDDPPQPVRREDEDQVDPDDECQYIQEIMDDQILDLDADYEDYRILDSD